MNSWSRRAFLFVSSVLYTFIYWVVIYIGIDKLTFEISSKGFQIGSIHFSSAKVVYDLFLINIVISLLLAQSIIGVYLYLCIKIKKFLWYFNVIQLPIMLLFGLIIYKTEAVIPFIKNWHVALLGTNFDAGGF